MTVRSWGDEILVNTNTNATQVAPKVTALADGGWVVTWTDNDPAGGDGSAACIKFQLFDASGAKVGGEVIANSDAAGTQTFSQILSTDQGFIVAWEDDGTGGIEFRRFDGQGVALDPSDVVLSGASLRLGGIGSNGNQFIITYTDEFGTGGGDVFAQRYQADGTVAGGAIPVAATAVTEQVSSVTELAGGGFVVAWTDDTNKDILIRGFNAAGAQTFAAKTVSTGVDTAILPDITALANGTFVVAWHVINPVSPDLNGSLRARIVGANGTLLGAEFAINTLTAGDQFSVQLAALPTGGFVAVYDSNADIRGQVFDSLGARVGAEFVVNSSTSGNQQVPDVTALADGRFVVTWEDTGSGHPDDPSFGIREQVFDPRDGVVTGTDNADNLFGHNLGSDDIKGLGGSDTLHGLGGDDALYGGDGNDLLIGGSGGDLLFGGFGNDTFQLEDGNDSVADTDGIDTVTSTITRSIATLGFIENLTLLGTGAINGIGNALANTITGNGAANVLNGGAGADIMRGGLGNDTYVVDNAADTVDETAGGGTDTVVSSIGFSLVASAHVAGAFERLVLSGSGVVNGTGNSLANVITGNAAANVLSGGLGNDILRGLAGNDTLIGGAGIDTLTGGTGKDAFVFNAPLAATNRDVVIDFSHVDDVIRLDNAVMPALGGTGALNPAFFRLGAAAADGNDHVIYNPATGVLLFDANGSAAGGVTQLATLANHPANVDASDFAVI